MLPANPVLALRNFWNKENIVEKSIPQGELRAWWQATAELRPDRRNMQRLGLLSGLRPGNLVSIRNSWIDLPGQRIVFPKEAMKVRREKFTLPLSKVMVSLVQESQAMAEYFCMGNSEWLFPTRDKEGRITHTQVWHQKTLPGQTGYMLRKTYATVCEELGMPESIKLALMSHAAPGIRRHYVNQGDLFDSYLDYQEQVSARFMELVGMKKDTKEIKP